MVKIHSEIYVVGAVEQGEEEGASWLGLAPAQCSVQVVQEYGVGQTGK